MARMNDDAQWIVMLGFIISLLLVFLALIVNQSTLVGKTTSESVLEFPKTDIQDARAEIMGYYFNGTLNDTNLRGSTGDLQTLALERRGVITNFSISGSQIVIHYNDGLTEYHEIYFTGSGG